MGQTHTNSLASRVAQSTPTPYYVVPKTKDDVLTGAFSVLTKAKGEFFGSFHLQTLPGCCGVAILSYINVGYYDKKNEALLLKKTKTIITLAAKAAYLDGYGAIISTQRTDAAGLPAFEGWTPSVPFLNGKTQHKVVLLALNLQQQPRVAAASIVQGGE